jgi:hypothetical protein
MTPLDIALLRYNEHWGSMVLTATLEIPHQFLGNLLQFSERDSDHLIDVKACF